jgi:hypothetical protein
MMSRTTTKRIIISAADSDVFDETKLIVSANTGYISTA